MDQLPTSITVTIALLTVFLCFIVVLNYNVADNFRRTRLSMTSFFFFIVITLSISFWQYTLATLPSTIPAFIVGALIGYFIGVRTAEKRLNAEGTAHYMEHFMHIHTREFKKLTWWSLINFYSVMSALMLINFVGLSTVIFRQNEMLAIVTSSIGAFLLGTIAPYLVHLWRIRATHQAKSTTSER